MLKNFFFDMDGTLIDCVAEKFIPPYKDALVKKFAGAPEAREIVKTVLTGAAVMVANDGSATNREKFMDYARTQLTMPLEQLETLMTEFYANEYNEVAPMIRPKPTMREAVRLLKSKGYRLIVTTNPLFPEVALVRRLEWGGYDRRDFDFITSYETSSYAKPSPAYYTQTLERLKLDPRETMIVGNDMAEDAKAGRLAGMNAYYLTDAPIPCDPAVTPDHEGNSDDFLEFVKQLPKI